MAHGPGIQGSEGGQALAAAKANRRNHHQQSGNESEETRPPHANHRRVTTPNTHLPRGKALANHSRQTLSAAAEPCLRPERIDCRCIQHPHSVVRSPARLFPCWDHTRHHARGFFHDHHHRHQRIRANRQACVSSCLRNRRNPCCRHQRSPGYRLHRLHAPLRLHPWSLQGGGEHRRQQPGRERPPGAGQRRAGSERPGLGCGGRRGGAGGHRPVSHRCHGQGPHRSRRAQGGALRSLERRHPHVRDGGQSHQLRRSGHRLQCLVHHELPGTDRQGAARQLRHQLRPDDHRACHHGHPENRGRPPSSKTGAAGEVPGRTSSRPPPERPGRWAR